MNITDSRADVMLLFLRRSSRSLQEISMQCTWQPVCDVTLGDTIDLDGRYIMLSMLKRLKLIVMTYSLEDTIKFENPKKSPYNLKILKNPLP